MELQEIKMIEKSVAANPELQVLWDNHVILSKQVDKLESKPFLIPSQNAELKELKKKKLDVKTNLFAKINANM